MRKKNGFSLNKNWIAIFEQANELRYSMFVKTVCDENEMVCLRLHNYGLMIFEIIETFYNLCEA